MDIGSNARSKELGDVASFVVEQIRSVAPDEVVGVVSLDTSLYEFGLDSLASMAVAAATDDVFPLVPVMASRGAVA